MENDQIIESFTDRYKGKKEGNQLKYWTAIDQENSLSLIFFTTLLLFFVLLWGK
jgi:hypothetical protein